MLRPIFRLLKIATFLIVVLAVVAGGYLLSLEPVERRQVAEDLMRFDQEALEHHTQTAWQELEGVAERGQELGKNAQQVLGTAIKPVENDSKQGDQPLHERALEYGRYLYCQEAIKEYERSN